MVPQCTVYVYYILVCLISAVLAYRWKYFNGENFPIYGIDIMLLRNQSMEKLQLDSRILSALGLFLTLSASKKKTNKKNKNKKNKKKKQKKNQKKITSKFMINYDTLCSEEGAPYMVTKVWMMSYNMLWDSTQWQNYSRSGQLHTITRWIITAMVDFNKFRSNLNNTNCSANMNTHLRHQHTHSWLTTCTSVTKLLEQNNTYMKKEGFL